MYTKYNGNLYKVQLWTLLDFGFFVGDRLLPENTTIEWFQHVTQIVLELDNQKNVVIGGSVYHF